MTMKETSSDLVQELKEKYEDRELKLVVKIKQMEKEHKEQTSEIVDGVKKQHQSVQEKMSDLIEGHDLEIKQMKDAQNLELQL